ncbi:acyl carrier protein [Streptomyces sp. NPDC002308]
MKAIHPKIVGVLTDTFKVPPVEIHPESTMDSLEMDSLAVAEFAVIIKETLGIHTPVDTLHRDATLADISEFIRTASRRGEPVSNTR